MIEVPAAYRGREHTWLKHRVLREYLEAWAHKLGSVSRKRPIHLWYVDCFAGPWKSRDENLEDTSIFVALEELRTASGSWSAKGYRLRTSAIFVEKNPRAFAELQKFLAANESEVECHLLNVEFGDAVGSIQGLIGKDAAFLFVDPTGWKGAAMRFIAPIANQRYRDVLVNVMFNDINRFKHHPDEHIRSQMRDFFGLEHDELEGVSGESALMELYRSKLKEKCGVSYAADLAIMHPTHDRTKLRLVVGGNDSMVLKVFRDVERKVIGVEAAAVRAGAKQLDKEKRTGQQSLFGPLPANVDSPYFKENMESRSGAAQLIERILDEAGSIHYRDLWPAILEAHHVVEREVGSLVLQLEKDQVLLVENRKPGERAIKDSHLLTYGASS